MKYSIIVLIFTILFQYISNSQTRYRFDLESNNIYILSTDSLVTDSITIDEDIRQIIKEDNNLYCITGNCFDVNCYSDIYKFTLSDSKDYNYNGKMRVNASFIFGICFKDISNFSGGVVVDQNKNLICTVSDTMEKKKIIKEQIVSIKCKTLKFLDSKGEVLETTIYSLENSKKEIISDISSSMIRDYYMTDTNIDVYNVEGMIFYNGKGEVLNDINQIGTESLIAFYNIIEDNLIITVADIKDIKLNDNNNENFKETVINTKSLIDELNGCEICN